MRCPKCQYIGFDTGAKCRHCGYDFSLSAAPPAPDDSLPIRADPGTEGPLSDLPLFGASAGAQGATPSTPAVFRRAAALVSVATPRAPLAVRRATPDPARLRARVARARAQAPELDLLSDPGSQDLGYHLAGSEHPGDGLRGAATRRGETENDGRPAGPLRRLAAGLVDTALMLALDVTVVSLTLKVCGLRTVELTVLPLVPLAGFLLLLNGGYWVSFTAAGGQTLGKMLTGIKVITADAGPVGFGNAVVRTAAIALSALPAGLGLVPALVSADRRALHDRLAATRVIEM